MKTSCKQLILDYLKQEYPRYIHKQVLEDHGKYKWGFMSETIGRKCRELEAKGLIEAKYGAKKSVSYRWKKEYIVHAVVDPGVEEKGDSYPITFRYTPLI